MKLLTAPVALLIMGFVPTQVSGNEVNKSAKQERGDNCGNKDQAYLVSCAFSPKGEPHAESYDDCGDCPDAELGCHLRGGLSVGIRRSVNPEPSSRGASLGTYGRSQQGTI